MWTDMETDTNRHMSGGGENYIKFLLDLERNRRYK